MPLTHDPSAITLAAVKTRIARAAGVQGDTEWEAVALEMYAKALRQWQKRRNWLWLGVEEQIALNAGQDEYDLDAKFHKPVSVRAGGYRVPKFPDQLWDKLSDAQQARQPLSYTLWNASDTGKITFLPAGVIANPLPSGLTEVNVKYIRLVDPALDPLDIPAKYEDDLIELAQGYLIRFKGGDDERARAFIRDGLNAIEAAIRNEVDVWGEEDYFVSPADDQRTGWDPDDYYFLTGE